MNRSLHLGIVRDDPSSVQVSLPAETLLRHMMVLGSSGSGKTVLSKVVVEECVRVGVPASAIPDLDGQVLFEDLPPGALEIDEETWSERAAESKVIDTFVQRFQAEPEAVEPVFIPVWRMIFRDIKTARLRLVWIEGITGREIDWA